MYVIVWIIHYQQLLFYYCLDAEQVLKTFIYEINNNKSKLWGELNINCAYYNYEENINSFYKSLGMKQDLSELGTPYKFWGIGDFNENGITELMLVQSSYSEEGSTLEFWEFNKGVFKKTLQAKDDICFILSANKQNHSMKLERNKYSSEADDYVSKISEIVWDSENFTYIEK